MVFHQEKGVTRRSGQVGCILEGVQQSLSCRFVLQTGQLTPIDLIVEERFHRAAPGGMGGTKAAGNYSPVCGLSHFPSQVASKFLSTWRLFTQLPLPCLTHRSHRCPSDFQRETNNLMLWAARFRACMLPCVIAPLDPCTALKRVPHSVLEWECKPRRATNQIVL